MLQGRQEYSVGVGTVLTRPDPPQSLSISIFEHSLVGGAFALYSRCPMSDADFSVMMRSAELRKQSKRWKRRHPQKSSSP